ncbi:hypothetical protein PRIPAC_79687 [Pristionchus pacificus]|uniref:Uncharacterized protein n=1 Tax=Pristionchus pacificus TaxID=54126 RepID=A0A2A6C3G7_PRIPA|nr:hypothetical protein PRIPAC_79687 [Pristionchus pacificus]|eukprot:PDM72647.1 hypothetical protein PRIPAC_39081 [Pristionchus pacificus]
MRDMWQNSVARMNGRNTLFTGETVAKLYNADTHKVGIWQQIKKLESFAVRQSFIRSRNGCNSSLLTRYIGIVRSVDLPDQLTELSHSHQSVFVAHLFISPSFVYNHIDHRKLIVKLTFLAIFFHRNSVDHHSDRRTRQNGNATSVSLEGITDTLSDENERYSPALLEGQNAFLEAQSIYDHVDFYERRGWRKEHETRDGYEIYSKNTNRGRMFALTEILDAPQGEVMRDLWQNQVASNRNPLLKAQPVARLSDYSDIMRFVNPAAGRDLTVVRLYRPIPTSSGADGYLTAMRSVPLPDQPIDSGAPLLHLASIRLRPYPNGSAKTILDAIILLDLRGAPDRDYAQQTASALLTVLSETTVRHFGEYSSAFMDAQSEFLEARSIFDHDDFYQRRGWKKEHETKDGYAVYSKNTNKGRMFTISEVLEARAADVMKEMWQNQGLANRNPLMASTKVAVLSDQCDIVRIGNPSSGRDMAIVRLYRQVPMSGTASGFITAMRSVNLPDEPVNNAGLPSLYLGAVRLRPDPIGARGARTLLDAVIMLDLSGVSDRAFAQQSVSSMMTMLSEQASCPPTIDATSITIEGITDTLSTENEQYGAALMIGQAAFNEAQLIFSQYDFYQRRSWKKEFATRDGYMVYSKNTNNGRMFAISEILNSAASDIIKDLWQNIEDPDRDQLMKMERIVTLTPNADILKISTRFFAEANVIRLYRPVPMPAGAIDGFVAAFRPVDLPDQPLNRDNQLPTLKLAAIRLHPDLSRAPRTNFDAIIILDLNGVQDRRAAQQTAASVLGLLSEQASKHFRDLLTSIL